MAQKFRKVDPRTWTDEYGQTHVVTRPGILNPTRHYGHRHLRRFVFKRDKFTCQICAASSDVDPTSYSGRYTETASNGEVLVLDHKHPRCAKGTNHPDNIQTLCEKCNRDKGGRHA